MYGHQSIGFIGNPTNKMVCKNAENFVFALCFSLGNIHETYYEHHRNHSLNSKLLPVNHEKYSCSNPFTLRNIEGQSCASFTSHGICIFRLCFMKVLTRKFQKQVYAHANCIIIFVLTIKLNNQVLTQPHCDKICKILGSIIKSVKLNLCQEMLSHVYNDAWEARSLNT